MPIEAESADGVVHEFPDGTDTGVIGKVMKAYAVAHAAKAPPPAKPDPGNIAEAVKGATHQLLTDVDEDAKVPKGDFVQQLVRGFTKPGEAGGVLRMGKELADVANIPGAAIGAAINKVAVPLKEATAVHGAYSAPGLDLNQALAGLGENVEGAVAEAGNALKTVAGAAKGGNALPKTAEAAKTIAAHTVDPEHAADVSALVKDGVKPTIGQRNGGMVRRIEEGQKSSPLVGQAVRDSENEAMESFNTAAYNRALANIDQKASGKVGRQGIAEVEGKFDQAYNRIKPKLAMAPDKELVERLSEIREDATVLPQAQQDQLNAIVQQRIIKRLGDSGRLDGEAFKKVESELTHLASNYKSSSMASERDLGSHIAEINEALRDNLERTSDPSVRAELKKINTGYAMFTRLQTAAANRVKSGGVFTPSDLLSAVKRQDRSVRKGAFARGDALFQDFAERGQRVLGNYLPDSGTTERMLLNKPEGFVQMAASPVTNAVAGNMLRSRTQRFLRNDKAVAPGTRNYLAQAAGRLGAATVPAVAAQNGQQ